MSQNLQNVGLFGAIEGGSVKNLTIEAEDIYGTDHVGILAGAISEDAVIFNIRVSGSIRREVPTTAVTVYSRS